jgi:hypothetical protein
MQENTTLITQIKLKDGARNLWRQFLEVKLV